MYIYENKEALQKNIKKIVIIISIALQLTFATISIVNVRATWDMIFTYTLANSSYSYLFINPTVIAETPEEETNGWLSGQFYREQFMANEYDKYDYAGVYWHQRLDVHPPLYYVLVHSISSIFPETYSNMYAGIVNLISLIFIDIILLLLAKKIWGEYVFASIPILTIMLMCGFNLQVYYLRMYLQFAAVCLWYLYLHISAEIDGWNKYTIVGFFICIIIGTQTHNYFYVYAAVVSIIEIIYLLSSKKIYTLMHYLGVGAAGIMSALIIFPWMIWQILLNQQGKHTVINDWNIDKIKKLGYFIDGYFFNGRGLVYLFAFVIGLLFFVIKRKRISINKELFLVFTSSFAFMIIIFTLDEDKATYHVPEYIPVTLIVVSFAVAILKEYIDKWHIILIISLLVCISLSGIGQITALKKNIEIYDEYIIWNSISKNNAESDCLYVSTNEGAVLDNIFFDIASYDEVKTIYTDEYNAYGFDDNLLAGRRTVGKGVIVYLPEYCESPIGAELLMAYDGFKCLKIKD